MLIRPLFSTHCTKAAGLLAIALCFAGATSVQAQSAKNEERVSRDAQTNASRDELVEVKLGLEKAKEIEKRLTVEIAALDKDRASINRALINTAKRSHELEVSISAEEKRLVSLRGTQTNLKASLSSKRGLLSEVLAALQRMGKNPPPAILVRPEDALVSVRSAILLGSVVPEIRAETQTLFAELRALAEISRQIVQKQTDLTASLSALADDERRLALLIKEKNSIAKRSRKQLRAEKKKSEELAGKAKSLEELIGKIEAEIASAAAAARAAKQADLNRQKQEQERLAKAREDIKQGTVKNNRLIVKPDTALDPAFADTARVEPAIAFDKAIGMLPMPVNGTRTHVFGSKSDFGKSHNNVGIETRPNSRVRSPADGWIVYAGKFRSYGQIVIINVGNDYHIVLSGMADVDVSAGQFVLAGEPIARMGSVQLAAIDEAGLSSGQPVLYVEFRKGKTSIDPSPWWSAQNTRRSKDDT